MVRVSSIAVVSAILLMCAAAPYTLSQTRINSSGTGGINIIKGQIFTPGGKRSDGYVTVKLQSMTFGELSLMTDQSGGFEFRALAPGSYTVVVEAGDSFEIFREAVTVDADVRPEGPNRVFLPPSPKIYTVPVYLQVKSNPDEMTGVINAKLAQVPKAALKHYEEAVDLAQASKLSEAESEFKAALAIYPALGPAYIGLGKIYLRTGKIDDALDVLGSALKYEPNDFDANLDYGIALFGKRDFVAAETQLNKAAQMNGTAVTPHYYLGLLHIQTKALEKAQVELEAAKSLKGDKNFPLLHRYLGGVYLARDMKKEAVAELETFLRLQPNDKDADRFRKTIADLKSQL